MTKPRVKPTKPKVQAMKLSPQEKAILDRAVMKANIANRDAETARGELNTVLALIGDRYDVDFNSGQMTINEKGEIVPVQGMPEGLEVAE